GRLDTRVYTRRMSRKRGAGEGTIVFHTTKQLWYIQVSLGYAESTRTPGKVTRRRKTVYGKTRKEVAEKLKVLLRDQQQGMLIATGKQTVSDYLGRWLEQKKAAVRARTWQSYESVIRMHIVPAIGRVQLAKLTARHIEQLLEREDVAKLAPRHRRYIVLLLRMALGKAQSDGLVPRNVAQSVATPRIERHESRVLSPDEARRLLDAATGDRLEALYSVALALGLRQGEALGLRWQDVDLQRGTLQVRSSLQRIDGKLQLVPPKTDLSRRTIAMPPATVHALREHKLRQLEERMAAPVWEDHDLVFPTNKGTPLEKSGITKRFAKLLDKAALPPMRFHDLRHSCASLLIAQGVPLKTIQGLLGHSSITMTGDVYGHLLPSALQEAASAMDAVLTGRK
ncbi:MAG TPA: site-specific integrase, partial [Herpetosiphonaceae bacterium]|nr:site-specific integrase [Herpetosiphonaceae bacterium]